MTDAAEVEALLATIDAGASGFTLCLIAPGVRLEGQAFDGVAVLQVLDGAMRLDLPGGDSRVVRAGQLAFVPGGMRPRMACDGTAVAHSVDGRQCLVRRDGWLVADATRGRAAGLVVAAARMTGTAGGSLGDVLVARLVDRPEGRRALAMLRGEIARATPGSTTMAVTLMSLLIVIGLRVVLQQTDRPETPRTVDRRSSIDRAIAAVRARPADAHTIDTLAAAAGMSRSTLTRYFRAVLKTTAGAFVQRARLTEAAALLRATGLPIKTVAAKTGFASRSHFSRAFRHTFGVDPSAWRDRADADR